jgi:hypothetical protein
MGAMSKAAFEAERAGIDESEEMNQRSGDIWIVNLNQMNVSLIH